MHLAMTIERQQGARKDVADALRSGPPGRYIQMGYACDLTTRATLLGRLYRSGAADEDAWRDFVDHYGRQIYKWCRHWQLQDADAEEVTQRVLVLLVAKMKDFVYDPAQSFRRG